jgi:hypothetical protein
VDKIFETRRMWWLLLSLAYLVGLGFLRLPAGERYWDALSIGVWNVANAYTYCGWLLCFGLPLGLAAIVFGWLTQALLVVLTTSVGSVFRNAKNR